MLHIDPELLRNSRQSAYRSAVEQGYRSLRFEGALERQFEAFYTKAHLMRLRMAGFLAIVLFSMFVVIDISTLPSHLWERTVAIRVCLVLPTYVLTLAISYVRAWRAHLRLAVYVASLTTGLGTVAVIGIGLEQGFPIRYEGILLVPCSST
ncbi:hypothetical protein [Massilia glaciei]|uniref:GGDEF domain-containing protein n=1 Tax=Massilia glaciei TaxID=1524097 RepID=A0A2U2HEN1_9BURK|nr:hypothetical protein [Massilia glaciei]PWF42099.1 hypothetical protein C7C56_023340 [Massilia glaciei]